MARTPEGIIEDHLILQCKRNSFVFFKFTAPGKIGVPDRVVIGNGHTAFIELKAPGEELRPSQEVVIDEMRAQGAIVFTADSKELVDTFIATLKTPANPSTITGTSHAPPRKRKVHAIGSAPVGGARRPLQARTAPVDLRLPQ